MKGLIKNKKAVEINIATIIILVLAILVLVILALYFTGGMKNLWDMIIGKKMAYTTGAIEDAKNKCENIFTIEQFCTQKVDIYNSANKTNDYICCWQVGSTPTPKYPYYNSSSGQTIYVNGKGSAHPNCGDLGLGECSA